MDVFVSVAGAGIFDELRSLYAWLVAEEEFRGRVGLVDPPPRPGTLGSLPEMLAVVLAPGGASAVLASAVIAWMRHRTGEVVCKVTRPDGASVEVSAQRVRGTDLAHMRELVGELSGFLEDGTGAPEPAGSTSAHAAGRGCR